MHPEKRLVFQYITSSTSLQKKARRGITFHAEDYIHRTRRYRAYGRGGHRLDGDGDRLAGIVAECGDSCTCATCLVHVDGAWSAIVGPPSAEEEEMLDSAFEVIPTCRCPARSRWLRRSTAWSFTRRATRAADGAASFRSKSPSPVTLRVSRTYLKIA